MMRIGRKLGYFFCAAVITLLAASCENDLKDVEKISSQKAALPVDRSTGVELTYSDSAEVKAKLLAPELLQYNTANPYYEMNKGVTIIIYDENQQETSRITADKGLRRQNEKIVELRNNVVVVNKKGETFKSEELIWNENTRRCYSNKLVSITTANQTIYGTSFWAPEDFSYYEISQSTESFNVSEDKL